MKRILLSLTLTLGLLAGIPATSFAVTSGTLDGNGHPNTVLLLMEINGAPAFRCTGTLLSPTVLLTAGHCTNDFPGPAYSGMRVFYESDVANGNNNYPFAGPNAIEAVSWAAHPLYETAPFLYHDAGIVVLASPVPGVTVFGTLPSVNQFDAFKTQRGLDKVWFTSVGYGLQQSWPDAASFLEHNSRTRYVAYPKLNQINVPGFTGDFSMLLSNNTNTGGTCFGDSGGPNFLRDTTIVAGITSFGINGNCAGTGGVFRTDRQNVLDFINAYLD
jgi:hypothetical protein